MGVQRMAQTATNHVVTVWIMKLVITWTEAVRTAAQRDGKMMSAKRVSIYWFNLYELLFKNIILTLSSRIKYGMKKKPWWNYITLFCTFICQSSFLYAECDLGYFGLMCKDECSPHCWDPLSCNHVTGSCDGGCKDGWIGSRCRDGADHYWLTV